MRNLAATNRDFSLTRLLALLAAALLALTFAADPARAQVDLATLQARGRIGERARQAGIGADFSQRIREGIPGEEPLGAVR